MCLDKLSLERGARRTTFGVYKSTDNGLTWDPTGDGRTTGQDINALAVDPYNEEVVYAGTVEGGVFKTIDGGATWQACSQGLRVLDVRALAIDPKNPQVLYAGAENGGVYKSINGGTSW